MTPSLAFAISLIYCVTVDRDVDAHEVGQLISAFGGKVSPDLIEVGATHRDLFHRAVQYVRTSKSDDFLTEATLILTETQRLMHPSEHGRQRPGRQQGRAGRAETAGQISDAPSAFPTSASVRISR